MYQINGKQFKNKSELSNYIKDILNYYPDGYYLSQEDFEFMLEVLEMHEDAETKIGHGVIGVYVNTNPQYKNTRNFFAVRVDGTETDFSYLKCLTKPGELSKLYKAMRFAVEPQTRAFRDLFFSPDWNPTCPYTGQRLNYTGSHVDHIIPFKQIADKWLGLTPKIEVVSGEFGYRMKDKALEDDWCLYHQRHATLQVVSRFANLSVLKVERNA